MLTFVAAELLPKVEELEEENKKLRKALEAYERERNRYKHAHPEMTGAYFLSGGHGTKDGNQLPMYVEIVPAYGCGWSMVYKKQDEQLATKVVELKGEQDE